MTRVVTQMTIDDAEHYTPEQRAQIVASYPEYIRDARAKGIPVLGSGAVFPISEADLKESAPHLQKEWARIAGIDFGWDHPTGLVWCAHDRDADCVHVYDCYRRREATPLIVAGAARPRGEWIPIAWPHDGLQHDKGSGEELAKQYREQHLNMLPERATFDDGKSGVEAGITLMLDRMQTGRLKVAEHLNDWWEEFRLYHRKDGIIVKEGDDLMAATRYAIMMLRFAAVEPSQRIDDDFIPGGWMG